MSRVAEVDALIEQAKQLPTWTRVQPILGLARTAAEDIDITAHPTPAMVRELRMGLKDAIAMMGEVPLDTSELDELRAL